MPFGFSDKNRRIALLIGRLILGGIFLAAAYGKLRPQIPDTPWSVASVKTSLSFFAMAVNSFQLLSDSQVSFVAHTLPFAELILGLWLLSGWQLRFSAAASSVLLIGFFGVMVRTYMQGLEINCGCFGPGERLGPWSLVRDGSMLAFSLAVTVVAFLGRAKGSRDTDAGARSDSHALA
jgi:uncharacterized membrane protein YphA (DoxX/SURF4 family)